MTEPGTKKGEPARASGVKPARTASQRKGDARGKPAASRTAERSTKAARAGGGKASSRPRPAAADDGLGGTDQELARLGEQAAASGEPDGGDATLPGHPEGAFAGAAASAATPGPAPVGDAFAQAAAAWPGRPPRLRVGPSGRILPPARSEVPGGKPTFTVFLDRDGVFDRDRWPGVLAWGMFEWLPGVKEAFAKLNRPHIQTCLATNQPLASLGLLTRKRLVRIHAQMKHELEQAGGRLDRIEVAYGVPFVPTRRRKPRPGMLEDAAAAFLTLGHPVDKRRACFVGDKLKDAKAAAAYGIPCILVATSTPRGRLERNVTRAGLTNVTIAADLPDAVGILLQRTG